MSAATPFWPPSYLRRFPPLPLIGSAVRLSKSIHFAAQAVMSGTQDIVIAAGVESMIRVPMGLPTTLPMQHGIGTGPLSRRIEARFGVTMFSQFDGAEMIAEKYQFTKQELDSFALESQRKAARATRDGEFQDEIVPL